MLNHKFSKGLVDKPPLNYPSNYSLNYPLNYSLNYPLNYPFRKPYLNITDGQTNNILTHWAPVGAKKQMLTLEVIFFYFQRPLLTSEVQKLLLSRAFRNGMALTYWMKIAVSSGDLSHPNKSITAWLSLYHSFQLQRFMNEPWCLMRLCHKIISLGQVGPWPATWRFEGDLMVTRRSIPLRTSPETFMGH